MSAGSDGLGTSSMFVIRLPFDDNVDAADRLALGMHELGCDAPVAYDGPSALALVDAFRPQLIVLSAGFDAHCDDPLAELRLVEADFAWLTGQVATTAERHCGGRIVSVLEGGYDLHALAASVAVHVRALMRAE